MELEMGCQGAVPDRVLSRKRRNHPAHFRSMTRLRRKQSAAGGITPLEQHEKRGRLAPTPSKFWERMPERHRRYGSHLAMLQVRNEQGGVKIIQHHHAMRQSSGDIASLWSFSTGQAELGSMPGHYWPARRGRVRQEIGRASCRERVCT